MREILQHADTNLVSHLPVQEPRIRLAPNRHDTCYQYYVVDEAGHKLLKVKFYDKVIDLMAREHFFIVGSRVNQILGSSRTTDALSKRVRIEQKFGVTRLEVSILADAITLGNPLHVPMRTLWHLKTRNALKSIATNVLNDEAVKTLAYRRLFIHDLLSSLAQGGPNILAIGRYNAWIINARTAHMQHFIGTHKPIDLLPRMKNKYEIMKLKTLALRHAAIGSAVKVFYLHQ